MIQISRNELKYLSTSPWSYKFLYLKNSDYYSYSNFIYICFEDYDFNLSYDNIKYCHTSNDPISNTDSIVRNCSFITIVLLVEQNIITNFLLLVLIIIPLFIMMEADLLEDFMLLLIITN